MVSLRMRSKLSIIIFGYETNQNIGKFVVNIDIQILMNYVFIIFKLSTELIYSSLIVMISAQSYIARRAKIMK